MPRRSSRRRRVRALIASVVGIAFLVAIVGAALYGWHQLTRHQLTADSCQVVGNGSGGAATVYSMDPDQLLNASIIADVALRRALPERAVIVALATAQQESKLRNLDYGDADSLGLFQQRPSQGWGSSAQVIVPTYAAGKFYDALLKVPSWQALPVGDAAQQVQRSAFPQAYASWEPRATALAGALTGTTTGMLTCRLVHPGTSVQAAVQPAASESGSAAASSPAASSPGASTPPTSPALAAAAVTAGLRADLVITAPVVAPVDTRTATVTVLGLRATGEGDDTAAAHRDATVASWAVAHAAADGVLAVVVGDQEWRPDKSGWHPVKTPAAAGQVVITVGRS
jgi:hypothetical protein